MVSEEQVVEALRKVYDPELPVSIYELGLIYGVEVDPSGDVRIEMTLTAPGCPVAQSLPVGQFDLAFAPQVNHYNGKRTVQLKVLDWRAGSERGSVGA